MQCGVTAVAMGGDDAGKIGKKRATTKRPKGWYAKDARVARSLDYAPIKAAREQARRDREAERMRVAAEQAARKARTAATVAAARDHEAERAAGVIARSVQDRRAERLRVAAIEQVGKGRNGDLAHTYLRPTPEQIGPENAKVKRFEEVIVEKHAGSDREVHTLRRVSVNRVKQLYDRGIFTDDTYPAVLWYQRQWEAAGFVLGASAANWGEAIVGERSYGATPKSEAAMEARHMFRFARGGRAEFNDQGVAVGFEGWSLALNPARAADVLCLEMFDQVVLGEATIAEAAEFAKCAQRTATLRIQSVALRLLGRIAHLLPVRAVGAPGSEPVPETADTKDISLLRRVEALRDGTAIEGERAAAAEAAERLREQLDPIFIDRFGFLREWDAIAAITRMRVAGVADDEILAGIGEG